MRLDQAVAARNPAISRRRARELIASRRVLVNERVVGVASREVGESDRIAIVEDVPSIEMLASGSDWIAVAKPPGMPVQPTRERDVRSLEELLRIEHREIYLVHRLDSPTSGVVLFARSRNAAARFSKLFAEGSMQKTYLARISGSLAGELTVDTPIDGKDALTIVRPVRGDLVEVDLSTGRTHQIRIHLASIGHPVLGDLRYGGPPSTRLMLHAWKLEHPTVGKIEAPVPAELGGSS